jgi:hypothetical protein
LDAVFCFGCWVCRCRSSYFWRCSGIIERAKSVRQARRYRLARDGEILRNLKPVKTCGGAKALVFRGLSPRNHARQHDKMTGTSEHKKPGL